MEIKDLNPQAVFSHFQALCSIPHPSGHEQGIARYLISFAQQHGLDVELEDIGNVIITKKASQGREDRPTVILQAHMDMVPVARAGTNFDFEKTPITPIIKTADDETASPRLLELCQGDYVCADNTTLGADDGIGIALILAILEDDTLPHGPITAIFTVEEESSMKGAINLDPSYLEGDYLINLDSEDFGQLFVGCAGSINANITYVPELVKVVDCEPITVTLSGLVGGHSGADINLNRGNAIDILSGILAEVADSNDFFIQKFHGGEIRNSIPNTAYVELAVPRNTLNDIKLSISAALLRYQELYADTDPDMHIVLGTCSLQDTALSYTSSQNLISFLRALPNGVLRMSLDFPNVVETSCNLSTVRTSPEGIDISLLPRSLKDHGLDDVIDRIDSICALLDNVEVGFTSRSYGWSSPAHNQIIDLISNLFKQKCQIKPEVTCIHAGLECGYFSKANPKLQMISVGPTVLSPHSADECVSIKHTQIVYEILKEALSQL